MRALDSAFSDSYKTLAMFIDSIRPKNQPGKRKESNNVMCSLGKNTLEMAEAQRFANRNISKIFYIG